MDICFWLRRGQTNSQGKAFIYCTITINGNDCEPFSTGVRVVADKWDTKTKTSNDDFRDTVRQELNEIENKLRQIKMMLEYEREELTAQIVAATFKKMKKDGTKKTIQPKAELFFDYFRKHLKNKADEGAKGQTQENDFVLFNNIWGFCKSTNRLKIKVKSIDIDFIDDFVEHIKLSKVSQNHINRHISIISKVLDLAVKKKAIKANPLSSVELKYTDKFDPVGVELSDIHKLENVEPLDSYEEKAIDIFLFLCGTGIDYCDYLKLKNDDIRKKNDKYLLRYERQKTDTYLRPDKICKANPILKDCAVRILNKYGGIENLPKIANLQNVNRSIQAVAKRLNINVKLTTKRGRKTFANLSVNKEKHSDEQTAYQLGHTSTKKLKYYRQYNDDILSNLLEK